MCGSAPKNSLKDQITPQFMEQQKINAEMWNYYQTTYQPMLEKYSERVTSGDNQIAEQRQAAGQVGAEVMKRVDPSKVSPNPVKNAEAMNKLAKAESLAKTGTQAGVKARQMGEVQNIVNIGRGQATTAMEGLNTLAGRATAAALQAENLEDIDKGSQMNAIGSAVGTAGALGYQMLKPNPDNQRQIDDTLLKYYGYTP